MISAAPQSLIRSGFFAVDQVYSFRKAQTSTFYPFVDLSKNPLSAHVIVMLDSVKNRQLAFGPLLSLRAAA